MGFTVIFLLVGSSTACISSHLFVVVVEIVVRVGVLPLEAAVIVEPVVDVTELPVDPTEIVDSAIGVGVPPVDRPVVADPVVEASVLCGLGVVEIDVVDAVVRTVVPRIFDNWHPLAQKSIRNRF